MTRIEYDLLREQEPQLKLWPFNELSESDRQWLLKHTRESLTVMTAAQILISGKGPPWDWSEV